MNKEKRETILNKVREFFSSNDIDAEVVDKSTEDTEKFESVLLVDGVTEVTIEPAIEVGAAIVLTAEDGTPVPAPAGEYELQDGRVLVVAEDGVVAEVKDAAMPEEEPMAEDKPEQADKVKRIIERIESEKIFEKIEVLEGELKSLRDDNKFLKEENEVLKAEFVDTKNFTKETFETLLSEPSKEPVVKTKKPLQFAKEESFAERWANKYKKDEQ